MARLEGEGRVRGADRSARGRLQRPAVASGGRRGRRLCAALGHTPQAHAHNVRARRRGHDRSRRSQRGRHSAQSARPLQREHHLREF